MFDIGCRTWLLIILSGFLF